MPFGMKGCVTMPFRKSRKYVLQFFRGRPPNQQQSCHIHHAPKCMMLHHTVAFLTYLWKQASTVSQHGMWVRRWVHTSPPCLQFHQTSVDTTWSPLDLGWWTLQGSSWVLCLVRKVWQWVAAPRKAITRKKRELPIYLGPLVYDVGSLLERFGYSSGNGSTLDRSA